MSRTDVPGTTSVRSPARLVGAKGDKSIAQMVAEHNAAAAAANRCVVERARAQRSKRARPKPKSTDVRAALPRSVWFLRCRGGLFILSKPFFTRKEARAVAKRRGKGETPVGPFVLAERRGQE